MIALAVALAFTLSGIAFGASGRVNINTATADELESLHGVGPKKAQAIINYRQKNGSFQRLEDLMKVSGIGPKTFTDNKDRLTISGSAAASRTDAAMKKATGSGKKSGAAPATGTGKKAPRSGQKATSTQ
jgi:competence protein ComEA